jgi:hypothetical protein
LKHRFVELAQVAFFTCQEEERDFAGSGDPLEHRFLELAQFANSAGKEAENVFEGNKTFSNCPKSHSGPTKRQKIKSQVQASSWNIAF